MGDMLFPPEAMASTLDCLSREADAEPEPAFRRTVELVLDPLI
jgi:hypothetical protein